MIPILCLRNQYVNWVTDPILCLSNRIVNQISGLIRSLKKSKCHLILIQFFVFFIVWGIRLWIRKTDSIPCLELMKFSLGFLDNVLKVLMFPGCVPIHILAHSGGFMFSVLVSSTEDPHLVSFLQMFHICVYFELKLMVFQMFPLVPGWSECFGVDQNLLCAFDPVFGARGGTSHRSFDFLHPCVSSLVPKLEEVRYLHPNPSDILLHIRDGATVQNKHHYH